MTEPHYRPMIRDDIARLPEIDRSEVARQTYAVRDGRLALLDKGFTHPGWDQRDYDERLPAFHASLDNGAAGWSALMHDRLVAIALLDGRWIGRGRDTLDLTFFHVTRQLRGQGVGSRLFDLSVDLARTRGAKRLYVSAADSRNTVDFYLNRGMRLATPPDPALHALEPTDIHLTLDL